jgi:HPt (histidine-containing phosphotransfer) domain-containing protein
MTAGSSSPVAKRKREKPGVTKYADHDVIVIPNRLKKIALRRAARNEPDPLMSAERALEELSAQFGSWMADEYRTLEEARLSVHLHGLTDVNRKVLFRAAHDIKGHGTMFGYPMAADVADSLCRTIEHTIDAAQIPLTLIDQCVDSVGAIVREHGEENAEQTAAELARELRMLADELLGIGTNQDDPVNASPPLAPA